MNTTSNSRVIPLTNSEALLLKQVAEKLKDQDLFAKQREKLRKLLKNMKTVSR